MSMVVSLKMWGRKCVFFFLLEAFSDSKIYLKCVCVLGLRWGSSRRSPKPLSRPNPSQLSRVRRSPAGYPLLVFWQIDHWFLRMKHFVWQSVNTRAGDRPDDRPEWKRSRGRPRHTWIRRAAGGRRRAHCRCWMGHGRWSWCLDGATTRRWLSGPVNEWVRDLVHEFSFYQLERQMIQRAFTQLLSRMHTLLDFDVVECLSQWRHWVM